MKEKLLKERAVLLPYILAKIESEDWHAAIDGLMDLRDIDSKLEVIDAIENK